MEDTFVEKYFGIQKITFQGSELWETEDALDKIQKISQHIRNIFFGFLGQNSKIILTSKK